MGGNRSASFHGAIGGALAATAIVVFFLIVDAVTGEVLDTPAFLASVLLGSESAEAGAGLIALYTLVHYAVFIGIGVATAALLGRIGAPATLLLGLVLGFLLFDVVFYASVVFTGVNVIQAIGWPTFLAGNLLAGLVLMFYLSRAGVARGRSWREALAEHRVAREGIVAGLLGAVAVAAWFFVIDLVLGRMLYTPGALGSALFHGVTSPTAVQIGAGTVLGYTALHFAGFVIMGLVFAVLVARAEASPPLLMGLALLFVTFETLLLGLVAIVAAWLLEVLAWWSIGVGNLIAAGVMATYLWRRHPRLRNEVARADGESLEAPAGRSASRV